ncbi:MAG: DUF5680 domain-containing protein [bacterium]
MRRKEVVRILDGAMKVFFKAMLAGYAGGCDSDKVVKVKTPDGYTTITFTDGDFVVVDRYCVTSYSDFSAGTTTIFYKENPVWIMFYAGKYPEKVIPFLKESLVEQYKQWGFRGGRGYRFRYNRHYKYTNEGECLSSFTKFKGREEISTRLRGKSLGFHEYCGVSMI